MFLRKHAKKNSKLINESEIIFIHDAEMNRTGKIKICEFDSNNTQLAWLSMDVYQNRLEFLKNYQKTLIAKSSNETLSTSTICQYEMATKTCGAQLIHPIKPNFENNIFLLVQLIPLTYTIFDIKYKIWMNATNSDREAPMGKIILNNFENTSEKIYDTIRYGFQEKIKYNSTEIPQQLKGQYEYSNNYIDLNEHGEGSVNRKMNYTFSHILPARSYVNVSLIGIWADHTYEISSAILQFEYGSGYVTTKNIENIQILVSKIMNVRTEYTNPFSLDTNNEIVEFNQIKIKTKADQLSSEYVLPDEYQTQQGSIYPGFHPYFIVGCIVVSVVFFAGFFGVCKNLISDRKERKYRQVPAYQM